MGMNKGSKEVTLLHAFGLPTSNTPHIVARFSDEEKAMAAIVRELARQLNTESILALSDLVYKLRKGEVA